jgi:hypothetical protein
MAWRGRRGTFPLLEKKYIIFAMVGVSNENRKGEGTLSQYRKGLKGIPTGISII